MYIQQRPQLSSLSNTALLQQRHLVVGSWLSWHNACSSQPGTTSHVASKRYGSSFRWHRKSVTETVRCRVQYAPYAALPTVKRGQRGGRHCCHCQRGPNQPQSIPTEREAKKDEGKVLELSGLSGPPKTQLLVGAVMFYGVMAGSAFALTGGLQGVSLTPGVLLNGDSAGASFAFLAVFLGMLGILTLFGDNIPGASEIEELMVENVLPILKELPWWGLLVLAFSAGFGEEAFFRGWLQSSVTDQAAATGALTEPQAIAVGVAIASVIFGALHAVNPLYFLWATGAGVLFGVEYNTYGLLAASTTHFLYDWIALFFLVTKASIEPNSDTNN